MTVLTRSSLALLTLSLAALIAEATPTIGDRATFDLSMSKSGMSQSGVVTFELTQNDVTAETWTQTSTTEFNGQSKTQTQVVPNNDLMDDFSIDYTLANCRSRGGVDENLKTPAGDFKTCVMPANNAEGTGKVWVAKVPFGYAKWVNLRTDGATVTGVIKSFQNGSVK